MATPRRRTFLAGVGSLGVIGLIGGTQPRGRIQTVSECMVIDESGEYRLDRDIVHAGEEGDVCIHITADDVTLDGQGHTIHNEFMETTVLSATGDDVTVRDLRILGFNGRAMRFEGVDGGLVEDCETRCEYGMNLRECEDVLLQENILSDESQGIRVEECVKCRAADNRLFENDRGITIRGGKDSSSARNFVDAPYHGISLSGFRNRSYRDVVVRTDGFGIGASGPYARILKSTVVDTSHSPAFWLNELDRLVAVKCIARRSGEEGGFRMRNSENVRMTGCQAIKNGGDGFVLDNVDNSRFIRNVARDNDGEAFRISEDSTGNRFVRNDPPVSDERIFADGS